MGNFYTSYTLRGTSQQSVVAALAGRSAIVTPEQTGCVVVFDEESDEQNQEVIAELASRLSGQFRCPLLAVLNHDDGFLWYQLYLSGELVDEYNSQPGYFDTTDEDASRFEPEGGDAKKLCDAFESKALKKVEEILKKPSAEDNGYIFAIERHTDLAHALGIPVFGSGGFNQINEESPPAGLAEDDWVRTKDLIAGPPLEDIWRKPVPGYYKVSFRAHPKMTKSIPIGWMPGTWTELECKEQELSDAFRKATAMHRDKFKHLGFAEQGFKKLKRVLNPNHRDDGGINYLDGSRCHFGQLIYNKHFLASLKAEKEGVVIAFTAVFQNDILSCTNNTKAPVDVLPHHKVIRIESNDVAFLHQNFIEQLEQRTDQPHRFPDLQALQTWFDSNALETLEDKVRRGLWVRMSDFEVAVAKRSLLKSPP
jgi:hypothetical protein